MDKGLFTNDGSFMARFKQMQQEAQEKEKAAEHRGSSRVPAPERQREARPRFAPEFDGLNCFESIVSS